MEEPKPIKRVRLAVCTHELQCLGHAVISALKDISDPESFEYELSDEGNRMIQDMTLTGMTMLTKLRMRHLDFTEKEIDLFQVGLHFMIQRGAEILADGEFMASQPEDKAARFRSYHQIALGAQRKMEAAKGYPFVVPDTTYQSMGWMAKNYPPAHN